MNLPPRLLSVLPVLASLLLTSCCHERQSNTIIAQGQGVAAKADEAKPGTVSHVVLVWLKKPGDAESRRAVIDASNQLRTIPGVLDIRAGAVLPSTRPVVDSTYDVGVVVTFRDAEAMQGYLTHPTHLKVLNDVLKPNADHYRVFDFVTQ